MHNNEEILKERWKTETASPSLGREIDGGRTFSSGRAMVKSGYILKM